MFSWSFGRAPIKGETVPTSVMGQQIGVLIWPLEEQMHWFWVI